MSVATATGTSAIGSVGSVVTGIGGFTPPTSFLAITPLDAIKPEGNSGTADFTFTVTRTGDLSTAATVSWSVFGPSPSPANGGDFAYGGELPAGTLEFAPNQVSQTLTVSVSGDGTAETDEGFAVLLSSPSEGVGLTGFTTAVGTIQNDDAAIATTVSVAAGPNTGQTSTVLARAYEGDMQVNPVTYSVTRSGDISQVATVNWSVVGSGPNPAGAADFWGGVLPSGTVNFQSGQAIGFLTVNIAGDLAVEPDKGFNVVLANPSGGMGLDVASAGGLIMDDDFAFGITPLSADKAEGDSGTTAYTFTITRSGLLDNILVANWTLAGTGANPADAADFEGGVLPQGEVWFDPGQTEATLTINVTGDTLFEPDEGFTVTLTNYFDSPAWGPLSATGVIRSDETISVFGTTSNDRINRSESPGGVGIDASQGGNDTIFGSAHDNVFLLGAALGSRDRINGGLGNDRLLLNGDYSAGITLTSTTVTNVENFVLAAGNSYKITTNNATVASGATLTVDARALGSLNSATINGSSESNGKFVFLGGAGNDVFTGGSGADVFVGAGGADALKGNSGADVFRYLDASDSPFIVSGGAIGTSVIDVISSFQAGTDKLDLSAFLVPAGAQGVLTKSTTAFSTGAVNGAGFFGTAGVAVEQASLNRVTTTRVYVDANHDGNLGAGDALIQLTGVAKGAFGTSSITF